MMEEILDLNLLESVAQIIKGGGVIAYPTEAVFGFGCDPDNLDALDKILKLKARSPHKGMIIIASEWEQVSKYTLAIPEHLWPKVKETWPGPFTWIFPASKLAPSLLTGGTGKIAIRISAHPIVRALCNHLGSPLVSTSANRSGESPIRDDSVLRRVYHGQVDFIVPGVCGNLSNPTTITDVLTGERIR